MKSDAYHAFMMDHAGGALSSDMAIAAELHILLSETGHETSDIWGAARHVLGVEAGPDCEHAFLPEALELARSEFSAVPWKRGLSGVHYAKRGRGKGKLMRLDPGQSAPEHSHSALEATIVLKGQFEDGHGVYSRGDLVLGRPGVRHRPAAHGDEMCVCFVAQEPLPFWRLS